MAAATESQPSEAHAWPKSSVVARVDILHDPSQAERVWRSFEDQQQFSTAYQRFDFLTTWQRLVGARENFQPFIVMAYDTNNRPLLLLPLTLRREHGVRIARFMGGKHANLNMALWDKEFAAEATRTDLDALVSAIRERAVADVLVLTQQPLRWRELTNPLALLPHQASANDCPLMRMTPGAVPSARISNSFRRRLKSKERKLQHLPGFGYRVATSDSDIKRLLDAFFLIKPQRMAERKLPNVFAEPGVEEFIRSVCLAPLASGGHVVDIHALECDDEVIAIFAGVADGNRFSMMFNTYTMSEHSRYSPGLILMRNIVDHYAGLGYQSLDLGIGSDDYKRLFCKSDEPIFDCFIPLSPRGAIAASALSGINRAKRLVKRNEALVSLVRKLLGVFR
jgi:CelD/BcsL family acetyltransferase involved in cellulose biosynthesis